MQSSVIARIKKQSSAAALSEIMQSSVIAGIKKQPSLAALFNKI